jgi:hypothetical protein
MGPPISKETYRRHAVQCVRLAEHVTDPALRVEFIEMAQAWQHLAEQAEKNSKLDVVYEPPPVRIKA